MEAADRSIALPATRRWEFSGRTYEQSELTIDGEAQLLSLMARVLRTLAAKGFPFERVLEVTHDDGSIDMDVIGELLPQILMEVPEFASESAVIMFGIFPVDEEGKQNAEYDTTKRLLRRSIKFTSWLEMIELFLQQNDYRRLAAPFMLALMRIVKQSVQAAPTETPEVVSPPSEEPSEPSSPPSTSSSAKDTATPVRSHGA